jgi:RNA polymerase sigma-70 factor (ECF subfamily)
VREARTEELVERSKAGDQDAFERLFARVAERCLLYVQVRLGKALRGRLDPVDVLQDVYLEAFRGFGRFEPRGDGSFLRWLNRIAENRIRLLAQHFAAQKRIPAHALARGSAVLNRLRAEQTGPATACARRESSELLAEAMQGLSDEEREVLLLRYFHGKTLEEIASQVERSEPTVRRLLGRGRLRLGRLLRHGQREAS